MKLKKVLCLLTAGILALSMTACSAANADHSAWAIDHGYVFDPDHNGYVYKPLENGYILNPEQNGYIKVLPDLNSTATKTQQGGVNYGPIEWTDALRKDAVREFLKGGWYLGDPNYAQDKTGRNYREMYQMATAYNNIPSNTNLELVLDASNLHLLGTSEANTGKTLEFQANPNVSLSWVRQLRDEEEGSYNYYCSYGVQINGTVRVYTLDDLNTNEGQNAVLNIYDKYYPTLASTWAGYAASFAGLVSQDEIRAAKLQYITSGMERGTMVVYEIIPSTIVITAPFLMNMPPQMNNAARFTTPHKDAEGKSHYAYDLCLSDSFLDELVSYKADFISRSVNVSTVESYYSAGMFPMLDEACAAAGIPTGLQCAMDPNNAAGLKTQTTLVLG